MVVKSTNGDLSLKYRKEQSTMLANWQKISLDNLHASSASAMAMTSTGGSWLAMQRARGGASLGR